MHSRGSIDVLTSNHGDAPVGPQQLYLEFCGSEFVLDPSESLTFGRSADLVIDDNPYMHRVVGRFHNRAGVWWLRNRSRRQVIELADVSGPSAVVLAPGKSASVLYGEFTCRFSAGPTPYELTGALASHEWEQDMFGSDISDAVETVDWGRVDLNDDQKMLLVVLCEQYLVDPGAVDMPVIPNRSAAHRLGWSITKFNRKLDHLCEKLQRAGVPGVRGDVAGNASDRRKRVVEHAMTVGLVTVEDLSALDAEKPNH